MNKFDDINDNEIRLIGSSADSTRPSWRRPLLIVVAATVLLAVVVLLCFTAAKSRKAQLSDELGVYDPQPTNLTQPHPLRDWLYSQDSVTRSGCALKDTIVNDIAIRLYLPLNASPALEIGMRPLLDNRVILAFQAADIRADNHKIVGAFVEKGKPIAWGLSKKGYCAILPDEQGPKVIVGMADNSPLFEEATECGGYFFRQYPLVADGIPQESELKTQSIRRALCQIDDHICVVETQQRTGMHDFAILLTDIGALNAIYLIGSDAMGSVTDLNGTRTALGNLVDKPYTYTNFIFWTINAH